MQAARRQHIRCQAKQRGSAYLLVLGITMMLVVLGLSGIALSRVKLQRTGVEDDLSKARLAALSALDVTHKRIDGSSSWRNFVSNDSWSDAESYAGAMVQTKFVDEIDGSLADDATQPFRLYAKASVGTAVRVYSVEFRPDETGGYMCNAKTMQREADSSGSAIAMNDQGSGETTDQTYESASTSDSTSTETSASKTTSSSFSTSSSTSLKTTGSSKKGPDK